MIKSEKLRLRFDSDNEYLDIRACGRVEPHADYSAGTIPDGYYGVNCTLSGHAYMECDGIGFDLTGGDVLFIPRGVKTSFWGDPEAPVAKYWMIFRGRLADSLFDLFLPDGKPAAVNSPDACAALRYITEGVTDRLGERELSHALLDLFAFAFRKKDEHGGLADEIRRVLDRHIDRNITMSDLEKHFCLSEKTLERAFDERFDTTIYRYLRDRRFAAALRDLRLTDDPVGKIRERYRLGKSGYFAAEFRKSFGMTPGEYRERFRNKSLTLNEAHITRTLYDYIPGTEDYD